MPTPDLHYFLAAGTITKSALLGTSTNNWQAFPVQSDQVTPGLGWIEPEREVTSRPKLARKSIMFDKSVRLDGFYEWTWGWQFWTFGQLSYILSTFFGGPDQYTNPASAAVTVQTFWETAYVCFHAQMYRPIFSDDFKAQDGGYQNVVLHFVSPSDGVVTS